ncbi:hypothetical protein FJY71_01920 [candidate division WOR-3 bacterium]|nr:hypothetical protein [candidate division WOR-3 bacterium]
MLRTVCLCAALLAAAPAGWLSIGPYGGHIQTVAIDPHDPDLLYVVTYRYPAEPLLFRSTDAGAGWQVAGKFTYPDVSCLTVDPFRRTTLLACSRGDVLWRSTDAGETWQTVALPGHANDLCADPFTNGRIYAGGSVQGAHPMPAFLSSTDHGLSWTASALDSGAGDCRASRADPNVPGTLYAAGDSGRLLRSTDYGATWGTRNQGLPDAEPALSLAVCPADPGILLCGMVSAMFRSADTGRTWLPVSGPQKVLEIRFAVDNPAVAWALCRDSVERVLVSTDTGRTWSGPASDSILYRATDLLVDPRDGSTAWVNAYRGVLRTGDRAQSWAYRNRGLNFADIYTIAVHPVNQHELYVSAHDTRIFRTTDAGDSWTQTRGFWCMYNGMCCAIAVAPEPGADVVYGFEGSG